MVICNMSKESFVHSTLMEKLIQDQGIFQLPNALVHPVPEMHGHIIGKQGTIWTGLPDPAEDHRQVECVCDGINPSTGTKMFNTQICFPLLYSFYRIRLLRATDTRVRNDLALMETGST